MPCAWYDRSDWSVLELRGSDRLDLLNRLTTNDLSSVPPGSGKQTVILTEKARIIDVVTVCAFADHALMICSPGQAQRVQQWLRTYTIMDDVRTTDVSATTHMIEVMGPRAGAVVAELTGVDPSALHLASFLEVESPPRHLVVVRMPSVMEVSYWILGTAAVIDEIRATLLASKDHIQRLSNAEYERYRVLQGMGAWGHEYTEAYNPLEAGLLHMTSFTKGCYIGQEVVARLDSYNKVKQRLMGFTCEGGMEEGMHVVVDDVVVGVLTTVVPEGHGTRALGYIRGEHAHDLSTVVVRTHDRSLHATLHTLPMKA